MSADSEVEGEGGIVRMRGGSRFVGLVALSSIVACGESGGGPDASASPPSASVRLTTEGPTAAEVTEVGPTVSTVQELPGDGFAPCPDGEEPVLSSFDEVSGTERWTTCGPAGMLRSIGAADDAHVYVVEQPAPSPGRSSSQPVLMAIDVESGDVAWRYEPAAFPNVPPGTFLADGVIVVGLAGQGGMVVVGVDAATGSERWRIPLEREAVLTAAPGGVVIVERSLPPEEQATVITADASGRLPERLLTTRLTGFDRATGTEVWISDVSRPSPSDGGGSHLGAAGDDDVVVIALPAVVALDAATGAQRWTLSDDLGDVAIGLVRDGVVIMGGQDDDTTALSVDTGEVLWTRPGSPPYDDVWAAADGAVYLVDDGALVAYELRDGEQRWRIPVDRATYTWPWMAVDESLYTMWWNLEARSTTDGALRWTTEHPVGDEPIDDTLRMTSVAKAGSSLLVSYASGSGAGD